MFKFRRASLCSSKTVDFEIAKDPTSNASEDTAADECQGQKCSKGGSKADSRSSGMTSSSSSRSDATTGSVVKDPKSQQLVLSSGSDDEKGITVKKKPHSAPVTSSKWSFKGTSERLKANFIGSAMLDRKRKDRHESVSQRQEKKVIRSLSDDESLGGETDKEKLKDFRRTFSHDDFKRKVDNVELNKNVQKTNQEDSTAVSHAEKKHDPKLENDEPLILADQPLANTVRKFHGDFEPELQRQLERSMNYSQSLKPPRRHRRRHRSSSRTDSGCSVSEDEVEIRPEESDGLVTESSSSDSFNETGNETATPVIQVEESTLSKDDFHLEVSNLHHHMESSKPISFLDSISGNVTDDHVMLSPRTGFVNKEAMDLPPSPPMYQIQVDPPISRQTLLGESESTQMNSLSRQVVSLKKHLKALEEEYEQVFGYKPSHADKLNNRELRKCLMQLAKAKRELKQLKDDPAAVQQSNMLTRRISSSPAQLSTHPRNSAESLKTLDDTVKEIEDVLSHKRQTFGRPDEPDKMSSSQLLDEKSSMQKQLLLLEKRHGRPVSKQEKDIVRPLYDRYRAVKRHSIRLASTKEINPDLVPIMEHETLELSNGYSDEIVASCSIEVQNDVARIKSEKTDADDDEEAELDMKNESFNIMNLTELEKRQRQARDDKRKWRSALRKFESDFLNSTGRPPSKDEKYSSSEIENCYRSYKRARATIRLLDVLITKKKYPHLLVDLSKSED